ncbi:ATP-binding protein [Romboutsia sp.]|uniref:PAS domain-containing sensor histidine kinase n=1 Tax=Romboutsia sp. TaxID=1965302 RepID=UPI003F675C59
MILTDIVILKQFILDRIKKYTVQLRENKKELQLNKEYIEQWDTKISQEYDLQSKYKDEITNLNYKINKSIEEADMPIFILDMNKEYIYSNQSFETLINQDKVKIDNFNMLSYIQKKFLDSEEIINVIKDITNKKHANITVKSKDNKIYRFICTADIIEEQSIIICILNDITKSTVIQNKLKESEEIYKKLMDILNEGIIIHDESDVSYINSKALDLFNLKELNRNIKVEDIKKSISKKYRHIFLANLDAVKLGNKDKITNKLETKEGKTIEFISTTLNINESKMFISIVVDITKLENAISDIEQSEKTYKLLLHTLPEGIMIIESKSKKHNYLNESMIGILKNIGVENLNDSIKKYIDECQYGKFKKFTINSRKKVDIAIAIIERKEEGNLVVIVRELDCEHKMQKIKEELKNISQKSKFKTEFLYNIVNDIKEPINAIYTINNIVYKNKEKYKSGYIENYTRLLKQNCYRLIRLSNNIEEVNKIENGKHNLDLRKCDIVKLVKQIVNISQSYAEEKGIGMRFSSNINKKIVIVDVEKIEKIILNILSNAIKFTDSKGKIDININIENEEVYICVKDTGIGIPEDKIDTIFESFEQVDRTLSRGAEGTGIGLYLVKKLSEIHNIKLDVESKLGEGSEFKIIINNDNKYVYAQIDDKIYSSLSDNEKIEIEFSDIYFDMSS